MRFAHFADCHLGSWRQPELQKLNLESFKKAVDICIQEKVDFILFAGDLFDSAYPPIEILKEAFSDFKRLNEAKIRSFIIAGSHDYSVSGRTFLDVLEKAGFCRICRFEKNEERIILKPCNYSGFSVYGYPGKKSGLEVDDIKKIELEPSDNFKILMLHTTMESAKGNIPVEAVDIKEIPNADYYALGHLHLVHEYNISENKYLVYPGPVFPNNFAEIEELKSGSFYIVDVNGFVKLTKKEIKLKEVLSLEIEIDNALTATEKIISELEKNDLDDRIVLLKVRGIIRQGKHSDIKFHEIQQRALEKGAYVFLKNTGKLKAQESEIELQTDNIEQIEETLIDEFSKQNSSQFNRFIFPLMNSFNLEKQEDEKKAIFESRLLSEINKILNLEV
jgi:DNA repair exonuclease SbcCD nuclease subunit